MGKTQTVYSGDRSATRAEIEADARRLATWLSAQGIGENDVVAALLWNGFGYLALPRACALLGAYFVPLNWHLTRGELDYILRDCGASILVGHDALLAKAGFESADELTVLAMPVAPELAVAYPKVCKGVVAGNWVQWAELDALPEYQGEVRPGNRGGIFYTSGTTGNPKGVRRMALGDDTWARVLGRTLTGFGLEGGGSGHVALAPGPLYHSAPNAHALTAWAMGMDLVLMPRFDAEAALDLMAQHHVSHLHMVPTMFSRLLALPDAQRAAFDPAALIAVCHGAAPCPVPVKQAMIDWFGPVVREYYAGTETGVIACSTAQDWLAHPGTVGHPVGECEVRVIDEAGAELAVGQIGRLICRSDSTTSFEYHNRASATQIAGWPGFVELGDIGYLDAEGFVYLTDRSSEIVISGGVNIYPAEIEKELAVLPGVADCAVLGVPMADLGEGVIALVEPAANASPDPDDLIEELRRRIAGYKLPRKIVIVDRLPREDSGKIRKRLLRDSYNDILST